MDLALPGASGIEAMRRMLAREPDARVLIFSVHEGSDLRAPRARCRRARLCDEGERARCARRSGALGRAARELSERRHLAGARTARAVQEGPPGRQLSAREFEVLRLLVQGYTLPSIAEKLGLSQKTVANHQSVIRQKFGADNGVQLAQMASRLGLQFSDFAGSFGSGSPA